jgi:molybdenum cofactor cytidylyltransferase
MAQGIILAAGYASRAKSNKMLFMVNGKTLIEHAINGMKPFVSHVFVVTGYYDQEIQELLSHINDVTCVYNTEYELGMFSSIQSGVFVVDEDFFVLPGDCPFVEETTYQKLLSGFKKIRVPSYHQQRGHPIWIDYSLKDVILKEPSSSNLKIIRNRYDFETIDVEDSHVLNDIDTLIDFEQIKKQEGR